MKKLMFGAALAATGMTFAANPVGQVYDVQLSIKTTAAATATVNNKQNPLAIGVGDEAAKIVYRKQASQTWKGLIWGCSCESINGKWEYVQNNCEEVLQVADTIKGCVIWDTKTKVPMFMGDGSDLSDVESIPGKDFGWKFIHAINKDGKQVEGTWAMTQDGDACNENTTTFEFAGAGFGTANLATTAEKDGDDKVIGYTVECTSYIKSISGNFAGWMKAPYTTVSTDWSGCTFCGFLPGTSDCEYAVAWDWCKWDAYCDCDTEIDENLDRTAAYGTWSVKYNSSLSKKLSQPVKITDKGLKGLVVSIRDTGAFKSLPYVEAAVKAVEEEIWYGDEPTECDDLAHALALAKQNTYAAEQAVEAVSYENLKNAQVAAAAEVVKKTAEKTAADTAYEYAAEAYTIANGTYETALYNQTNVHATIIYKNASGDEATVTATGCAKITAAINEFEIYTLVKMETQIPGLLGVRTSTTWAQCKAVVAEFETATVNAKADLVKAEQNKAEKYEAQATAAVNLVKAEDAKTIADNNLANITMLQYQAQRDLDKAEAAEAVAQKAYDDAGCED